MSSSPQPGPDHRAWQEIGRVRSVQSARREARIEPRPGMARAFEECHWLRLRRGAEAIRLKVELVQAMGDAFRVVFAPGVPRELVGSLRGCPVLLPPEEIPTGAPAAWTVRDLVGLRVRDAAGSEVGEVDRVYETAAHGAFGVLRPDGTRFLLPAIDAVIVALDWDAGLLTLGDIAPYVVEDAD